MKPQDHQEIYRVAFESANSELTEIGVEFERLRARMERVERLVAALKPLVGEEEDETASSTEDPTGERSDSPVLKSSETKTEPVKIGSDPFQRRIDHVLGIGAGIRDVRSFTRQF